MTILTRNWLDQRQKVSELLDNAFHVRISNFLIDSDID